MPFTKRCSPRLSLAFPQGMRNALPQVNTHVRQLSHRAWCIHSPSRKRPPFLGRPVFVSYNESHHQILQPRLGPSASDAPFTGCLRVCATTQCPRLHSDVMNPCYYLSLLKPSPNDCIGNQRKAKPVGREGRCRIRSS